jgi:two-component system OmpR family sensor kinase
MSRVPIRIRLTLAFTVAMALVLAATGLFLYLRLGGALSRTVDQGLQARAVEVAALAQQADTGLSEARGLRGLDHGFAQVLAPSGVVLDATPGLPAEPLLTRIHDGFVDTHVSGEDVRLFARPVTAQSRQIYVVVGTSLEPRAEALADLERQLLIGGPVALLLTALAGYGLAAAALRPVERMSEQAATISAASAGRRLPVPPAADEIGRLGVRLNEMLARLEAALERERALVSTASHELRTPLALMKAEIELALDDPGSAQELAAALRSAGAETDRLAQLADDLLLLASLDGGGLRLRRTEVPVGELLATIATRFARRAEDASRTLRTDATPGLLALADRRRLEQALSNLVENALRHGSGTVRLIAAAEHGSVCLRVTDEGLGFPPQFIGRAFDRFSRAPSSRAQAGTGLGLAIVAAIAHAHGGTATASNHAGGGAEVELHLPHR